MSPERASELFSWQQNLEELALWTSERSSAGSEAFSSRLAMMQESNVLMFAVADYSDGPRTVGFAQTSLPDWHGVSEGFVYLGNPMMRGLIGSQIRAYLNCVHYVFSSYDLRMIATTIPAYNTASWKWADSMGWSRTGELPDYHWYRGRRWGLLRYVLTPAASEQAASRWRARTT